MWKLHFDEWNGSAVWVTGDPSWVQAQDASDRAVGGWIGIFSGIVPMSVKGREILVSWPDPIVRAARCLEQHDRAESSTYRELWAILFMFESFGHIMQDSWVRVQADNASLYSVCSKSASRSWAIHNLLVRIFWVCYSFRIGYDIVWLPR